MEESFEMEQLRNHLYRIKMNMIKLHSNILDLKKIINDNFTIDDTIIEKDSINNNITKIINIKNSL